jgi:hypothetical protein
VFLNRSATERLALARLPKLAPNRAFIDERLLDRGRDQQPRQMLLILRSRMAFSLSSASFGLV